MAARLNQITNANVYMNGGNLLGTCEEFDLPDLKAKMSEHKAVGMIAPIDLPSGMEKIEARFKWSSYFSDIMATVHNPTAKTRLTVRGSLETYEGPERVAETPVKIFLEGNWKSAGGSKFKQNEKVEVESTFNATAYKMEIGDQVIVDYDSIAQKLVVDGQDLMANFRANLGI